MVRRFLLELIVELLISRLGLRWTTFIFVLVAVLVLAALLRLFN